MNNVIETEGLTQVFGKTEALHGVTLAIPQGAAVALLGPNGAGKTTLLKLLVGLEKPTRGTARVLGLESARLRWSDFRRIGYTSDEQHVPSWMSVKQLCDYTRQLYPGWDDALANRLIDLFSLPRNRRLSQLSRGMRAKAMLTLSLAYRPELLLLDEPLSGLDIVTREEIMRGVLELATSDRGLSIMLSSHEIDEVERLVDWIVILMDGELRTAEPLETLQARFRQIEIVGAAARTTTVIPKAWWVEKERNPSTLRFAHTAWVGDVDELELQRIFPTTEISATPMTLREIYRAFAFRFEKPESEENTS